MKDQPPPGTALAAVEPRTIQTGFTPTCRRRSGSRIRSTSAIVARRRHRRIWFQSFGTRWIAEQGWQRLQRPLICAARSTRHCSSPLIYCSQLARVSIDAPRAAARRRSDYPRNPAAEQLLREGDGLTSRPTGCTCPPLPQSAAPAQPGKLCGWRWRRSLSELAFDALGPPGFLSCWCRCRLRPFRCLADPHCRFVTIPP